MVEYLVIIGITCVMGGGTILAYIPLHFLIGQTVHDYRVEDYVSVLFYSALTLVYGGMVLAVISSGVLKVLAALATLANQG